MGPYLIAILLQLYPSECSNCMAPPSLLSFFLQRDASTSSQATATGSENSQPGSPSPDDLPPGPTARDDQPQDPPSPDVSTQSSPSPTPSFSTQHPLLHAATNDHRSGHRPFLNVVFDARLDYDELRTLILQGLTTVDFDNLRQACRSIDHCLMMPSTTGGLRYLPDLIDKCHEFGLPAPPALTAQGLCPNPPQSMVRIRACQCDDHLYLRRTRPHQAITPHPRQHLVCEVCRRNWHNNIGTNPSSATPNMVSRHDYWRVLLAGAHISLQSLRPRTKESALSSRPRWLRLLP